MQTIDMKSATALKPGQLKDWAYNALDCTGTLEIFNTLHGKLDEQTARTYAFERAAQGPAVTMALRGVKVNVAKRNEAVNVAKRELRKAERAIGKLEVVTEVWDGTEKDTGKCPQSTRKDGKHSWPRGVSDEDPAKKCTSCGAPRFKRAAFNANSPQQVKHLLHDLMGAPKLKNKTGEVSTDKETLMRMKKQKPDLAPLIDPILVVKDMKKQIGFLGAKLSDDNRYHSNFNIGTAWTGRQSSSSDNFGRGGNLQNIAEKHRHIFEADPGYEIVYADLKQAESNVVAHLAGDEAYIEAHASGDVHTFVTRLVWPDLPWTGDLKEDKTIAKQNPDWDQAPGHNFRFQAKRIQHGGNYGLSPYGISRIAKIPLRAAREAYHNYHSEFPYISGWQASVKKLVVGELPLINPLGRKVRLFGRPDDEHTYKQGLSFLPQSLVADIINIAMWRVWKELDPHAVELLAQVHDALLFQLGKGDRALLKHVVLDLMAVPVDITDYRGKTRTLTIETEAAVGRNWGHKNKENPHGLVEIDF